MSQYSCEDLCQTVALCYERRGLFEDIDHSNRCWLAVSCLFRLRWSCWWDLCWLLDLIPSLLLLLASWIPYFMFCWCLVSAVRNNSSFSSFFYPLCPRQMPKILQIELTRIVPHFWKFIVAKCSMRRLILSIAILKILSYSNQIAELFIKAVWIWKLSPKVTKCAQWTNNAHYLTHQLGDLYLGWGITRKLLVFCLRVCLFLSSLYGKNSLVY